MSDKDIIEDLKLQLTETEADLNDALELIVSVLAYLGLSIDDLRDKELPLSKILKGVKKLSFDAVSDQEAFVEKLSTVISIGQRLGAKYEGLIQEIYERNELTA